MRRSMHCREKASSSMPARAPRAPAACSESKWPAEAGLAALWEDNKEALLAFPLAAAFGG